MTDDTHMARQEIAHQFLSRLFQWKSSLGCLPQQVSLNMQRRALIRSFYGTSPFDPKRDLIVDELEALAETAPVPYLANVSERLARIRLDFASRTGRYGQGSREFEIDRENDHLLSLGQRPLHGIAEAVVNDRLHTISLERQYRGVPRGRLFGHARAQHDRQILLERALSADFH